MLEETVTQQSNIKTTVFHSYPRTISSSSSGKAPLLIFIPGNPGFISYYAEYLTLIRETCTIDFEVLGISHAGFKSNSNNSTATEKDTDTEKIYTLDEQVQHKIEIIKSYMNAAEKESHGNGSNGSKMREIYILGHSVGCWLVQRLVDLTPELNYKFIGFICPVVINLHKSRKGSVLLSLSNVFGPQFYKPAILLSKLLSYTPVSVVNMLLNRVLQTDDDSVRDVTKSFITSSSLVKQSLGLASEEILKIQNDWQYQDIWFSKYDYIKKWIFMTSPDDWLSDSTQTELTDILCDAKNVDFDRDNSISHGFCIAQSEEFAKITVDALTKALPAQIQVQV